MTLWKTGALAGALFVAAVDRRRVDPIVHGNAEEPQRWEHDSDGLRTSCGSSGVRGRLASAFVTWTRAPQVNPRRVSYVDEVRGGSPAEKAGLKNGDGIVELDGERVRSVDSSPVSCRTRRLAGEVPTFWSRRHSVSR